jgi:predicted transcriptional regulator
MTMASRCEIVAKQVLPIFRALIAKELINTYNLTQIDAAKKLGTTQAAISYYLHSKRAFKIADHFDNILPRVQTVALETARSLVNNEIGSNDIVNDFCKICPSFCKKKQTKDCIEDYKI